MLTFSMDDLTPGELLHIRRYSDALEQLAEESVHYTRNRNLFRKWDNIMRLRWIERIEQNAREDKQLGTDAIVLRVTMNRLDEEGHQ